MARPKAKAVPEIKRPRIHTCKKCGAEFNLKEELEMHDTQIHKTKMAIEELRLLEQGYVPDETKLGMPFKGKNRIIVS